ncbi:MAG: hypothetical protein KME64_12285 [Scytonematopsis contorta HA4267-MV1]|jgi:hypothetical protein|nr:hypothetical protein [Scytonematopsis contorta HA4267-MV1]
MQEQLLNNAPKPRCYKCGTTHIEYVCHHCGRLMCSEHTFFSKSNISNKLLTLEFAKLGLNDTECEEEPFHCSDCMHLVSDIAWGQIFIASLFIVLSILFLVPNLRIKLLLLGMFIGLEFFVYGLSASKKRKQQIKEKPHLPVLPNFDKVQIREKVEGHINLDNGKYKVKVSSLQGRFNIHMSFNSEEHERHQKDYRLKYDGLADKFHAGFAVLNGSARIKFSEKSLTSQFINHPNDIVIRLIDYIKSQPILMQLDRPNGHKKNVYLDYDLLEKIDTSTFPIQLVLSFIPGTDRKGLEMAVQWKEPKVVNNNNSKYPKIKISEIELLEFKFPPTWGRIETINLEKNASFAKDSQVIIWQNIPIDETAQKECRSIFQVQFEESIDPESHDSYVTGKINVICQNALSGLDNVTLYFPTGKPNKSFDANKLSIETEIEAKFEISLANLRYQHIKLFPDNSSTSDDNQKNLDLHHVNPIDLHHVSPTYNAITLLTDAMSSHEYGFYVKQVIENKPTINPDRNLVNRSWDILGRYYEGVYPIDFQINLLGFEENEYTTQQPLRMTRIKLTVEGTFSNDEMKQQIEGVWETLQTLIQGIFHQLLELSDNYDTEAPFSLPEQSSTQMTAVVEEDEEDK